jgi:hypothetical protein
MKENDRQPPTDPADAPRRRPAYEPPRIAKKRSLSRATLFTGEGPSAEGPSAGGGGLVGDG